jgi:myo-inositol-1(or 4)-monophosphatase
MRSFMRSAVLKGGKMDPLTCAVQVAQEAGALLVRLQTEPLDTQEKGLRGDLVTAADRASEKLIVRILTAAFPKSSILAEEGGASAGTSDERWIVDPLDGTTNYAHGYPLYCVSIAYEKAGEVRCGAVFAPALGELFAAELGAGATCNGATLEVSKVATVAEALVCTGFHPARYDRNGRNFAELSRRAQGVRRDGSAALDLAFVAAGRFDAFWESDLHAWDVAAGLLLICEAGGATSGLDGAPLQTAAGSTLASNGLIHAEMVRYLMPPAG